MLPHAARRVHGPAAKRRSLGLRLRLADVVSWFFLQAEGARARPWLSPSAVHSLDALPRNEAQARPRDGIVPRRIVLGHGVPRARASRAPCAVPTMATGDASPRLCAAPAASRTAVRPTRARAGFPR